MRKRFFPIVALIAALTLVAAACGGDDDNAADTTTTAATGTTVADAMEDAPPATVVDIAASSDDFSTLVAAVQAAGLVETLQGEGPFTVFAPTNQAFDNAFAALGITAEDLLADTETLTSILTYHVLPQAVTSDVVVTLDGQAVATVKGDAVSVSVDGASVMIDDATVQTVDLTAGNGVVHVIDAVLLPPDVAAALSAAMDEEAMDETTTTTEAPAVDSIVDVAVESGAFPTLVAALQATGLDEVLAGDGPFTVFAPTEEAFAAALDALGITAEELLADTETLSSILTYHVVAADAPAEVVVTLDGQEVETVNGATVAVAVGDAVTVNNATVVQTDIFAGNGVIHVIDTVLLPPAG